MRLITVIAVFIMDLILSFWQLWEFIICKSAYAPKTMTDIITQPGQAGIEYWRFKIEDLWYRFALSFLLKSIAFLSEP